MMVLPCYTHGAGRLGSYAYAGKERRLPADLRVGTYKRSFRTVGSQVVNGAPSDHDALVSSLVRLRGSRP